MSLVLLLTYPVAVVMMASFRSGKKPHQHLNVALDWLIYCIALRRGYPMHNWRQAQVTVSSQMWRHSPVGSESEQCDCFEMECPQNCKSQKKSVRAVHTLFWKIMSRVWRKRHKNKQLTCNCIFMFFLILFKVTSKETSPISDYLSKRNHRNFSVSCDASTYLLHAN